MQSTTLGFRLVTTALVILAGIAISPVAEAAPKAAIVMDLRDGRILHSRSADARRHPASLTKMMTLYLALEAIRDGRLRLDRKVRVSRHAARQPASKLYLRAGQRVTVRSLIRATAIKSANDAAMVLAEAIGGSQSGFAKMMTRKARAMGMTGTHFRNPHGLTQRGHYSTARDMAILARHLLFDFPQYWNVFGRTTSYAAGKRIWTTNRLLRTYRGADGLKTGYTRAAGYSLAATAKRGRKHIVAVQLGADSSADRARRVTRLLDIGFARAPSNVRRVPPRGAPRDPIVVARSPVPPRRPGVPSTGFAAFAEALAPASAAAAPLSAESGMIEKIAPQARPARVGPQETSARQSAPAARPEPMSRSRLAPRTARLPVPKGSARDATRRSDGPIPRPRPMRLVRQGAPSRATGPGSFGANVDASARFARLFAVERSPV